VQRPRFEGGAPVTASWWRRAAVAVARRPGLWPTAARQVLVLARPGWWRRWPPVPAPDPAWVRFRLQTAYGDADRSPEPDDLVLYLKWCRGWREVTR
jgi:hypothetical protein